MSVANPSALRCRNEPRRGGVGILVFAKPPIPGRCKTRLATGLGAQRAALIYRAMLIHALDHACRVAPGRVTLCCHSTTRAAFFQHLARCYGVARIAQRKGDLGQRMHAAARWGLERHRAVVLMGSDQPYLGDGSLAAGMALLAGGTQCWLAPTRDGGYWAIGLGMAQNGAPARLFRGPQWSSRDVAGRTRTTLIRLSMTWQEALLQGDVDTARDWARLPRATRCAIARRASLPGLFGPARSGRLGRAGLLGRVARPQ